MEEKADFLIRIHFLGQHKQLRATMSPKKTLEVANLDEKMIGLKAELNPSTRYI